MAWAFDGFETACFIFLGGRPEVHKFPIPRAENLNKWPRVARGEWALVELTDA